MSNISLKRLFFHLLSGGIVCLLYLVFSHSFSLSNRIINALFLGCLPPLLFGLFRVVKNLGVFDLFLYSHRKLWKYGKYHEALEEENESIAPNTTEKLGSYADYLAEKKAGSSFAEPLLAGGLYLAVSLLLTFLLS